MSQVVEEQTRVAVSKNRSGVIAGRVAIVCCAVLATLQFVRSYFVVNISYLDLNRYIAGTERIPYQSRVFVALLLRHTINNPLIDKGAARMGAPLHTPAMFTLFLLGCASFALMAWAVHALYRHAMPTGRLAWLPYLLVLWMSSVTYVVRFQQLAFFPYDLLSAALFTLCVYLCYTRRYLILLPVFVLCCFTRETFLLVIPLVLLNIESLPSVERRHWKEFAIAASLSAIWLVIYLHLKHLFAGNLSESFSRVHANIATLHNPLQWSQVASACGYLLIMPILFWRRMPDVRLRRYGLLVPAWIAVIFAVGIISESRVFGELIGFLSVYCTILFEDVFSRGVAAQGIATPGR